jgi:hypothetical protein
MQRLQVPAILPRFGHHNDNPKSKEPLTRRSVRALARIFWYLTF